MEADASLSGASRQCPLSLLPAVPRPFHRSCTEQGNAVSVQRSGSRYLLSGIVGESPWGSQENFFGIRSGRSRRPCPDSLPGVFILTAKVASLFVRTFSHGCFVRIAERITSGADPLLSPSEALELARLPESATLDILSVAGLACAARKPAAAFADRQRPSGVALPLSAPNQRIIKRIPPSIPLYGFWIRCCALQAEELAANNVDRFGIVTSGTAPSDRDFDALCESALRIGREVKIGLCASLGLLTPERAARLREAGFTSYHHNLETSASHFSSICTTHAYEQDLETVRVARSAGFRVCSCGIFGLGETWEQRIELSQTLTDLGVDSLPLNFSESHSRHAALGFPPPAAFRGVAGGRAQRGFCIGNRTLHLRRALQDVRPRQSWVFRRRSQRRDDRQLPHHQGLRLL